MKQLLYLSLFIFLIPSCSSNSNPESEKEENNVEEENSLVEESIKSINTDPVLFKPHFTFEDFGIIASKDVFVENELSNFGFWEHTPEEYPIYFLLSTENEMVVLTGIEDEVDSYYKVNAIELPEESVFHSTSSLSFDFYNFFVKDVDRDGKDEYVISADIFGMVGGEDGMRPVRFIKSAVFTRVNDEVNYSSSLSELYNTEVGTNESFTHEELPQFLSKKYFELPDKPFEEGRKKMLRSLIHDMGIHCDDVNSVNQYHPVAPIEDGKYVTYASMVGVNYFVEDRDEQSFDVLNGIEEEHYPILIDSYQMVDIYSIVAAVVNEKYIHLSLAALPESETEQEDSEIKFKYENDIWVLLQKRDEIYFPMELTNSLEHIQDD